MGIVKVEAVNIALDQSDAANIPVGGSPRLVDYIRAIPHKIGCGVIHRLADSQPRCIVGIARGVAVGDNPNQLVEQVVGVQLIGLAALTRRGNGGCGRSSPSLDLAEKLADLVPVGVVAVVIFVNIPLIL